MRAYSFVTTFTITSSPQEVWDTIVDYPTWQNWWKGIQEMHVDYDVKPIDLDVRLGFSFYNLKIHMTPVSFIEDREIILKADGDLKGTGKFTFAQENDTTIVHFYWDVMTTKPWMNFVAPIARPFFTYSHNKVMHWFVKGLAHETNSRVLSASYK